MIGPFSAPRRGALSAAQVERELARLRADESGTHASRASSLNLVVVTDEESAEDVTRAVYELSEHYPSRAIVLVSDPEEAVANLEIEPSVFCNPRNNDRVCAERVTLHVEGPPAMHLRSFVDPLLIPDLPMFLWFPNGDVPLPAGHALADLADRIILDSGAAEDHEAFFRDVARLLGTGARTPTPVVGDLQWAALSPLRYLVADLFSAPERAGELEGVRRVEITHRVASTPRALLLAGWLSGALGWLPRPAEGEGQELRFDGPGGRVAVEMIREEGEAALGCVRLFTGETIYEVVCGGTEACVRTTRDGEEESERSVFLGSSGTGALLGEELRLFPGRDEVYEAALREVVEVLGPR